MSRGVPPGWFPRRGQIYFAALDKLRSALILSVDILNKHSLDVCVVPLTTMACGQFSLRVHIEVGQGGLRSGSWAKTDQVTTVEKRLLRPPALGRLPDHILQQVEERVRIALGLTNC